MDPWSGSSGDAIPSDPYARASGQDDRFVDYFGWADTVVTSSGTNDSGRFETNLRDERFLPFEVPGACATGTFPFPTPNLSPFDYSTISDVIVHIRYTARDGGKDFATAASKFLINQIKLANQSGFALLLSLRYDFPDQVVGICEWRRDVQLHTPQRPLSIYGPGTTDHSHGD